eukprot:TRINITY_DN14357_c0_g1_i1.p2 TRINITY_DN14357_c0_g1~~TRINITY_DN14357_c0_g1_i1.p2  ORF type:complete len:132 (-),score=34.24 TRINITY_DN14357_c0_g1_i1:451-846(-)
MSPRLDESFESGVGKPCKKELSSEWLMRLPTDSENDGGGEKLPCRMKLLLSLLRRVKLVTCDGLAVRLPRRLPAMLIALLPGSLDRAPSDVGLDNAEVDGREPGSMPSRSMSLSSDVGGSSRSGRGYTPWR